MTLAIERTRTIKKAATGSFDANKYRALLQQARISEASYIADIRRDLNLPHGS